MKKHLRIGLGVVALSLGSAAHASANLIENGGFENVGFGNPAISSGGWNVYQNITGWSTTNGPGIEVQNNAAGAPYKGLQHVELDSHSYDNSKQTNSTMQQWVNTVNMQSYTLQFAYSPRPGQVAATNVIEVLWNGTLLGDSIITGTGGSSTSWALHEYTVTGTGHDALVFRAAGTSDSYGGYLDEVSLTANPTATPIPGAVWLLGSGIAGLVGLRRRQE